MNEKPSKRKWANALFLIVPILIAGSIWMALRGSSEWPIEEIDTGIVESYCRLVASERYGEAYDECLSAAYRRAVSREDFVQAMGELREDRGALQSRELLRMKSSVNIFTGTRSVQLLYLLRYPEEERRNYVVVDNRDGEWRIEGTYRRTTQYLDFALW